MLRKPLLSSDDEEDSSKKKNEFLSSLLISRVWNSFGSCLLFSCYFSSIQSEDSSSFFMIIGCFIILICHGLWYIFQKKSQDNIFSKTLNIWNHSFSIVSEISLFFLFCRSKIPEDKKSTTIPHEYSYSPIIFSFCFIIPKILGQDKKKTNTIYYYKIFLIIINLSRYIYILLLLSQKSNFNNKNMDILSSSTIFVILMISYSIPTPSSSEKKSTNITKVIIILALIKCFLIIIGIYFFNISSSSRSKQSSKIEFQQLIVDSDFNFISNIIMKISTLLSICCWSISSSSLLQVIKNEREIVNMNEIKIAFNIFFIVLGCLSISEENISKHSNSMLIYQGLVLAAIIASNSIVYWISS
jgi:uncharacterized membrane protein YozB (DUF420 family)